MNIDIFTNGLNKENIILYLTIFTSKKFLELTTSFFLRGYVNGIARCVVFFYETQIYFNLLLFLL